jgi:hypothetical protein
MEMGDRISRDFFDRSPNSRFIPCVLCKRTMTSGGNHGVGGLLGAFPSVIRLRQKVRTIERKLSKSVPRGKPTAHLKRFNSGQREVNTSIEARTLEFVHKS